MKFVEIENQIEYYSIDKLKSKLKHYKNAIKRYAFIVHDKDHLQDGSLKTSHFHCVIEFNYKTYTFERIAKMFEIDAKFIQKPKKKGEIGFNSCLSYLVHDQDNTGKYKYSIDEVVANFDYKAKLEEIREQVEEVETKRDKVALLIEKYASFELTRKQLFSQLTFSEYNKNIVSINNATRYRNELSKNGERDMRVIYICGGAGVGKTTLAKFMANALGFDYYVSGSGKDVLDGYDNEECIILDDLRNDAFTKAELFKLLDNNTGSLVKSRYYNKAINHCRLMIITTINKPDVLYCWMDSNEPAKQFARRIGYGYIDIKQDKSIYNVKIDDECKDVSRELSQDLNMNEVYTIQGIQENNNTLGGIMKSVAKQMRKKLEEQDLPF